MPRKVFVAGEILTAADVNANLMDQAVMVFDDAAARTAAIPTPSEGMVTYLKDTDALEKFTTEFVPVGIAPAILQVKSTTMTARFTMSSTTFQTLTGLTVSITPTSTSSKVLVMVSTNGSAAQANLTNIFYRIMRDSTEIALGDTDGSRTRVTFGGNSLDTGVSNQMRSVSMSVLDSPNTTSAVTYSVNIAGTQAQPIVVNVDRDNSDSAIFGRGVSTITVMEVAD